MGYMSRHNAQETRAWKAISPECPPAFAAECVNEVVAKPASACKICTRDYSKACSRTVTLAKKPLMTRSKMQ
jgi:hypothetical protein